MISTPVNMVIGSLLLPKSSLAAFLSISAHTFRLASHITVVVIEFRPPSRFPDSSSLSDHAHTSPISVPSNVMAPCILSVDEDIWYSANEKRYRPRRGHLNVLFVSEKWLPTFVITRSNMMTSLHCRCEERWRMRWKRPHRLLYMIPWKQIAWLFFFNLAYTKHSKTY